MPLCSGGALLPSRLLGPWPPSLGFPWGPSKAACLSPRARGTLGKTGSRCKMGPQRVARARALRSGGCGTRPPTQAGAEDVKAETSSPPGTGHRAEAAQQVPPQMHQGGPQGGGGLLALVCGLVAMAACCGGAGEAGPVHVWAKGRLGVSAGTGLPFQPQLEPGRPLALSLR